MAERKRKPTDKKRAAYRTDKVQQTSEENDLKKAKADIMKELEADKAKEQEWYDKELDKNLKNIK